jgi:hypothetical protein
MSRRAVFCLLGVVIGGCGDFWNDAQRTVRISDHEHKAHHATAFSTPADLRLGFIRGTNDELSYCAEPLPDIALGSDKSASGSLAAAAAFSQSASATASLAQSNEQLLTDNTNLRRELDEAIRSYERETQHKYTGSYSRDASTSVQQNGNASLNLTAAARLAVTVSELGGRSPEVLLAREFLYRLCEARANNYFTDPKTYSEQQANALHFIQAIYEARYRVSDTTADAQLLKNVIDYNNQQKGLCSDRQKACEIVAAQEADKKSQDAAKNKCAVDFKKCLDKLELMAVPKPKAKGEAPAETRTMLVVPP